MFYYFPEIIIGIFIIGMSILGFVYVWRAQYQKSNICVLIMFLAIFLPRYIDLDRIRTEWFNIPIKTDAVVGTTTRIEHKLDKMIQLLKDRENEGQR